MYIIGIVKNVSYKNFITVKIKSLDIVAKALILSPLDARAKDQTLDIKEGTEVLLINTMDNCESFICLGAIDTKVKKNKGVRVLQQKEELDLLSKNIKIGRNKNDSMTDKSIEIVESEEVEIKTKKFTVKAKKFTVEGDAGELISMVGELADLILGVANATSSHHPGSIVVSAKASVLSAKIKTFL